MSTNNKAMEEALQAAVARMNHSAGPAGDTQGSFADPIGLMMTFFAKMMEGNESRSDLLEKIEVLQKDDIATLKRQMRVLHKQLQQALQLQQETLEELREFKQQQGEQQGAVASAVIDLYDEMTRVGIVDESEDAEDAVVERPMRAAPSGGAARANQITETARERRSAPRARNERP